MTETRNIESLSHRHRAQSIIQCDSLDQLEDEVSHGYYENVHHHKGSRKRFVLLETIYGFLWWSGFHSLTPILCNPSVRLPSLLPWQCVIIMSISLTLSSLALYLCGCKRFSSTPFGLYILRLCSLLTIVSNQFSNQVIQLLVSCVGGVSILMVLVASWWNMSNIDRYRRIFYHILGLLLMLMLRVWSMTFNPSFTGTFLNTTCLLISIIVITSLFIMDERTPIIQVSEISKIQTPRRKPMGKVMDIEDHMWVWLWVGLGCQLFIIQTIYADTSILLRWAGLLQAQFSPVFIIIALSTGLLLGNERNLQLLCSSQWLTVGILGYLVLTQLSAVTSFLGGLLLTVHLSSLWSQLYHRLTETQPYKGLPVAMVTYIALLQIATCQLINFNFLEWTFLLAIFFQWFVLRKWLTDGMELRTITMSSQNHKNGRTIEKKHSYTILFGHIIRKLSTVIEDDEDLDIVEEKEKEEVMKSVHEERIRQLITGEEEEMKIFDQKKLKKALIVLCVLVLLGSAYHYHPRISRETMVGESITVATWSLNSGYDINGSYNVFEATSLITKSDADVICLFDVMREFSGDFDSSSLIGTMLSMSVHYPRAKTPRVAILSSFSIISLEYDLDTVMVSLKTSSEKATNVICQESTRTRLVDKVPYEHPLIVITSRHMELPSRETQEVVLPDCTNSVIYYSSLQQEKVSCLHTSGVSHKNILSVTLKTT